MNKFIASIPYSNEALEPLLSEETISFHYGKHHCGYAATLNQLIKDTDFEGRQLESIVIKARGVNQKIFNNAAQLYNHDFYWQCLKVSGDSPSGMLEQLIKEQFSGFDDFISQYQSFASTVFGSGWSWLVKNAKHQLEFINTQNAGTPLGTGSLPVCVIDLWEHAYYLDYRNNRAEYLKKLLATGINWNFCSEQLAGS